MRIGIVTAMAEETLPVYRKLGNVVAEDNVSGVAIKQIETEGHTVYLATSGIGEIRAALAVQLLVDLFDIEAVLNFGFVGSLNPKLSVGEIVIAEKAVHHQFDLSAVNNIEPGRYDGHDTPFFFTDKDIIAKVAGLMPSPLKKVTVASGDVFVADGETKERLRAVFGADVCEMELAGICLAAERNNLPVFSMKVVSDGADESAPVGFDEVLKKGITGYEERLPYVLKALSETKRDSLPVNLI